MKKLILIVILLLLFSNYAAERPIERKSFVSKAEIRSLNLYSKFYPAYQRIRYFEGNYTHQKHDKGGETYGGVPRKYNKKWYGWKYIDKNRKKLKQNYYIAEAEFWVLDYYLDIWVKEQFYLIRNQDVANYVFDFRINSYHSAIKRIQQILNDMGQKVEITSEMDINTIDAINRVDADVFLHKLKRSRIALYNKIVYRDTSQKIFYRTWVNRANTLGFPLKDPS